MRRVILPALVALACAACETARAQENVQAQLQIRHRLEVDNRDFNDESSLYTFNLLRSRLGLVFTPSERVDAFVQLQDSRTFGEEKNTLTDGSADRFDLHQGFLKLKNMFGRPIDLKLGRMEINYGPQRLIGAVDWSNVGRSFDGGIATLRGGEMSADIFSLTEAESLRAGDSGDRFVHGVYASAKVGDARRADVFWIWQRSSPSARLERHTLGIYVTKSGRFHYEGEFAYQMGDITAATSDTTSAQLDVAAFMAALNLGVGFPGARGKPDVSVGVDYLSGDADAKDGEFKFFDTLYATNHKYYGFMDFFLSLPADTYGRGLVDAHARLSAAPWRSGTAKLAVHAFTSPENFTLADGSTSRALGTEVDLTLVHRYDDNVTFTGGASVFVPGEIFDQRRGTDPSTWFYVMTTFEM